MAYGSVHVFKYNSQHKVVSVSASQKSDARMPASDALTDKPQLPVSVPNFRQISSLHGRPIRLAEKNKLKK